MASKKQQKKVAPKVYDYSGLEAGMRLQVESAGVWYAAEVVQVSKAKNRTQAPVKITFKGYYKGYDEWVGGDRIRSKVLKEVEAEPKEKPGSTAKVTVKRGAMLKTEDMASGILNQVTHFVQDYSSLKHENGCLQAQIQNLKLQIKQLQSDGASTKPSPALTRFNSGAIVEYVTPEESAAMRYWFDQYDVDKSGTIEAKEFQSLMKALGERISDEEASEAISFIRQGGSKRVADGSISFNDFMRWWKEDHKPDPNRSRKDARYTAKFKVVQSRLQNPNVAKISTYVEGVEDTLEWRVYFQARAEDGTMVKISPWHDIPLKNEDGTYNFVCEIPKWTRRKNEIATKEMFNPIKQDTKNGILRKYNHGDMIVNYGAFPQTWEDPNRITKDTGFKGDNDPLDVMEVGMRERPVGAIVAVKVLGIIAMIDDGETDWKVLVIARDDPNFNAIDDLSDLETYMPNAQKRITEWLRDYKIIDGKPPNEFAFNDKPQDKKYAIGVIEETHQFWENLVAEKGKQATVD